MGELLGITGEIGSGKTIFATLLGQTVQNHAIYETSDLIIEVANRFNQLLEAELNFETTNNDVELVNQSLMWAPDVISEHLHYEVNWADIAIKPKDRLVHPEFYEKLFEYLTQVHTNKKLVEQTVTRENKSQYRDLLQWLGGYFVAKISPTIWYDELFRRIDLHETHRDLILISGVRYLSDAAIVRQHGGRVIHIARPEAHAIVSDVTEAERDKIVPDISIKNNGSLQDLQKTAETLWDDIAKGKPKPVYTAL